MSLYVQKLILFALITKGVLAQQINFARTSFQSRVFSQQEWDYVELYLSVCSISLFPFSQCLFERKVASPSWQSPSKSVGWRRIGFLNNLNNRSLFFQIDVYQDHPFWNSSAQARPGQAEFWPFLLPLHRLLRLQDKVGTASYDS